MTQTVRDCLGAVKRGQRFVWPKVSMTCLCDSAVHVDVRRGSFTAAVDKIGQAGPCCEQPRHLPRCLDFIVPTGPRHLSIARGTYHLRPPVRYRRLEVVLWLMLTATAETTRNCIPIEFRSLSSPSRFEGTLVRARPPGPGVRTYGTLV